ncbi:MAG TPA: hypothetical protein VLL08_30670 [Kineosporiaceae bacterium]|nr:hypothetical protein [Kineosporiaceae bacterium]
MVAEHQHERPPPRLDPVRPEAEAAAAGPRTTRSPESTATGRVRRPVTVRGAAALQRQAGNRAVSRLIANPAAPAQQPTGGRPATAHEDPKFAALTGDVSAKRRTLTSHPPATSAAAAAQAAAVAPADDKQAQGKAAQAEKMNAAKPGEFDKAAFVAAVNEAISAQAPKNLEEADDFAGSGKADVVKGQVAGKVAGGKQASAAAIEGATKAPPDTSAAKTKPVTPLSPDRPPATPAAPDANKAVPDPAPAAATDFSAGPKQVDAEMAEAGVTEKQLKADPEFEGALTAKKEAEQHSAAAPDKLRASEAGTLTAAKAQARMSGATAMTAMTGDRTRSGAGVQQGQQGTKSADEKRRAEATARLQKVFDATKAEVEAMLAGLDKTVDEQFTREEKQARDAFTAEHKQKMEAYKDERYSGLRGKARWVRDKFAGLPSEANQIFVTARAGYVNRMQGVISRIADTIGTTLGKAKARIAQGRTELQAEVQKLPADLQKFGRSAAAEFAGRFDELTESVNAKSTELVQTLASKYSEAMKSVDEEIEAEKEANKGFVAKAVDAVKGAIKTILALKDLLLNVLAKAASAVMTIIKDPIGFLGNLISAVGSGLTSFISNIGTHLKNGLVGWLMGAMASTGLQLPAKFDLKGIIGMIASLLGLTWNAIRGRIVSRGVPDQAVTAVEEAEPLAQKLKGEGVGGIWETIVERVGDLKDKLLSKISEYLIPTVLIAGITWLISLLNPASAFIKACKMIIDFITFIVERGAQIAAFVNSVLDAVIAIAGGGGGGVGALIEKALAGSIPVLIGALAAFLGIGGIANKVKAFFQSLSKPVMKAVDWVADKLVKFGKKIWGKLKAGAGKLKDKVTGKGADKAKDPKQQSLDLALGESEAMLSAGKPRTEITAALPGIRQRYGLRELDLRIDTSGGEERAYVEGKINPGGRTRAFRIDADAGETIQLRHVEGKQEQLLILIEASQREVLKSAQYRPAGPALTAIKAIVNTVDPHKLRGRQFDEAYATLKQQEAELAIIGRKYGFWPLHVIAAHKSKYVANNEIMQTYRGNIRGMFYGGFRGIAAWESTRMAALKAEAMSPARSKDPTVVKYTSTGGDLTKLYHCRYKDHVVDETVPANLPQIDHVVAVSTHWNTGHKGKQGSNSDHKSRTDFYSDISNLEILCADCNRTKGGEKLYTFKVGPDFRGPNE